MATKPRAAMVRYMVLRSSARGDWRACRDPAFVEAESPEKAARIVAKGRRGVYVAVPVEAWAHAVAVD